MCLTSDDRSQQARGLMEELQELGVTLFLDAAGAHAQPAEKLTPGLKARARELKSELVEHRRTQGTEVIDDPEERAHGDRNTLPAPELSRDDKLRAGLTASKRSYQGGQVVVNGQNAMVRYMRLLREERERREAVESGTAPPAGRYVTRFEVFN
jgi:hypothetical protein